LTTAETFSACGFYLTPGHFSKQIFRTDCLGAELFTIVTPVYYLSLDERLFQIPHGAQGDGMSAPKFAAAFGRSRGGDDWPASWIHDGVFRGWLLVWNRREWVKARLSEAEGNAFLHECALACGDTEIEADTLYWAVKTFGHRFYNPVY